LAKSEQILTAANPEIKNLQECSKEFKEAQCQVVKHYFDLLVWENVVSKIYAKKDWSGLIKDSRYKDLKKYICYTQKIADNMWKKKSRVDDIAKKFFRLEGMLGCGGPGRGFARNLDNYNGQTVFIDS
jgi:hypothetical protein